MGNGEEEVQRLRRIDDLFVEAWGMPPQERELYLRQKTDGDAALLQAVQALIAESESAAGMFTAAEVSPEVAADLEQILRAGNAGGGQEYSAEDGLHAGIAEKLLDLAMGPQPERVGKYRIVRLIAMGGMGAVYEAMQEAPLRAVALKLPRGPVLSRDAARRFADEAEMLGHLQHPGIAQIYEAGTFQRERRGTRGGGDGGNGANGANGGQGGGSNTPHPYFAMELVRGRPITQYAVEQGLSPRERLALLAEVCDAVEHAHQRGIIHRDLKPANIFVNESGRIKVLDFGIAKITARDQGVTRQTEAGQLVGTLAYMSPEQLDAARGGKDVDTRSDVYSLGVVLFELLTGQLPDRSERETSSAFRRALNEGSTWRVARALRFRPRSGDSTSPGDLKGDAARIVATALAEDRAIRYQSVAALAADIRRLLQHKPILAHRPSTRYVVSKFIRRNRGGVAAGLVLTVGSAVLLGWSFIRIARAEQETREQYTVARSTVDFLINEVLEDLERLSGTRQINRRMMEQIVVHSRAMLAQRPQDEQLMASHANLLQRMANLESEEGFREASIELLLEAQELLLELVKKFPDRPEHWVHLSFCHARVGDRSINTEENFLKAIEIDSRLVAEYPDNRMYLDNLGHSYERLGRRYHRRGRMAEAESMMRKRLEIADLLMERFPESPKTYLSLSTGNTHMSDLMRDIGRHEEAVEFARTAVAAGEHLHAVYPEHLWYTRWYVSALQSLGAAYAAAGKSDDAVMQFTRGLEITLRAVRENQEDVRFQEYQRMFEQALSTLRAEGG